MLLLYIKKCGILFAGIIEQRDSLPLLKLIDSIGDWPVASDDWNNSTGRNTSKPHSNYCLESVQHKQANVHGTHPHKQALVALLKYMCSHRGCVAIFVLSELLSMSFVGRIKRPAEALQLSSQVWGMGAWWVGRGAAPQSGLWKML